MAPPGNAARQSARSSTRPSSPRCARPRCRTKLNSIFVESSDLDIDAMGEFIKSEAKLWGGVIRAAKITVEQ